MKFLFAILLSLSYLLACGQEITFSMNDFYLDGTAVFRDDTTIMLTDNLLEQTGAMWYKDDIDLREPFHIELEIFFGCSDGGADGISFILHPEWSIGSEGEAMGVGGLSPSFGVEMDTYQNFHLADAHFDHVALMANGASHHKYGLTEPIPLHPNKGNVENCTFYKVIFDWNPSSQIFTYEFNGIGRIRRQIDLVGLIFNGNSNVFWGFGAATGLRRNKQLIRVKKLEFTANETLNEKDQTALLAGDLYRLPHLDFDSDYSDLPDSAKPTLDKLMRFQKNHPNHTIILDSFTESTGDENRNLEISTKRAESIAKYMISKGFSQDRLIFYGNGEANPIDNNETDEGRKNNHRVEVRMKIIKV